VLDCWGEVNELLSSYADRVNQLGKLDRRLGNVRCQRTIFRDVYWLR
jgi:hypothetical protein